MIKIPTPSIRIAVLAALLGSLAFVSPLLAAPLDTSEPPPSQAGEAPTQPPAYQIPPEHHAHYGIEERSYDSQKMRMNPQEMRMNPQDMKMHVENRIKTLHAKLAITPQQEPKWNEVAQIMRENETNISQVIQERHQDPENMTAVDDLKSYQKISLAHVDGLEKLIPAFRALYNDMSYAQKKKADETFGRFEGHRGSMAVKNSQ